jgi:hypothetical protein
MAITVDQASLGTQAQSGVSSSSTTTTATVASNAMIVMLIGGYRSGGGHTHSVATTGGLTWTQAHSVVNVALRLSLFYAFAPSGLASGTSLGPGQSIAGDMTWCMNSYLGVDSADAVEAFNGASATTAAWASGSVSSVSGNALIGGSWGDGTLRTSTATGPAAERIDFNSATTSGSNTLVDKLSVSGSDSLAGTWSGTLDHVAIAVAFNASAGGTPKSLIIPSYRQSSAVFSR